MEMFLLLFLFYLSSGEASEWKQFGEKEFFYLISQENICESYKEKSVDGTLLG